MGVEKYLRESKVMSWVNEKLFPKFETNTR